MLLLLFTRVHLHLCVYVFVCETHCLTVIMFLSQSVWFTSKKIYVATTIIVVAMAIKRDVLYERKEKAPYCVCIDLDCILQVED